MEEKISLAKGKKTCLLIAIAFMFFFNNGDTSLLSAAAPAILVTLHGTEYYALIFSVKMLSTAIFMLLCGRLSDKFGRRSVLLAGLVLVGAGYVGGGFAPSIFQLIIWRALTGIGCGLSLGIGYTIIGDLFSGRAYASAYMVQMVGCSVALIAGPSIGGFIVAYAPWQWVFWAIVPLVALTIVLFALSCPNYKVAEKSSLDSGGMILFGLSMSIILFILSIGGNIAAWSDPLILLSAAVALVLVALFFIHERRTDTGIAVLPVSLFSNRTIGVSAVGQLCMTLNSLCLLTYIPYYVQSVMGRSSTDSGSLVSVIYAVSTLGGLLITRRLGISRKYSLWSRITVLGESLALLLLVLFLRPDSSLELLFVLVAIYGAFASVEGTVFIMTTQCSLDAEHMAVGTSCITFVQAMASTLGSAIGGAIINSQAELSKGIMNVFIFALAVTVFGAVIVCAFLPGKNTVLKK